jgi:hypothetical protein
MSITKNAGRQYPLVAYVDFTYSDLTDATGVEAIDIPANATVIGGGLYIGTVFNSATSDTIDVGDGGDTDRYTASPIDVTALGYTALTLTGYTYTASDTIDILWDGTGTAPSTGAGTLIVYYMIDERAQEVVPDV